MRNPYMRMILWILVSAGISFFLISYFGLIVGLILSFIVFLLMNILFNRRYAGPLLGRFSFGVTYRCIQCNYRFKGGACPRCGSKMKKAEF